MVGGRGEYFLNYCFTLFRRNQFVGQSESLIEELLPLLRSSTILSSAVTAIGSLEAMRHGFCRTHPKLESPHYVAFEAYSNSISALQTALLDPDVTQRDDVIWATFFLGLFEVILAI